MTETSPADELQELLEFLYVIPVAIMKTDLQGNVLMANPESVRLLSPAVGSMIENIFQIVNERDPDMVALLATAGEAGALVQNRRVSFVTAAGEMVLSFDVFCSDRKQLLIAFRDVSDLVSYERQLESAALTDALTSLPNRRAFQERLAYEVERQQRYRRPFALVMADADHFKRVNDTYGHAVGDLVLKAIAERLTAALRTSDMGARVGGEEFAMLLPETDAKGALECAERAAALMRAKPVPTDKGAIPFTMSLGVATFEAGQSADTLFNRADEALYAAKASGRDRVVVWKPS